MTISMFNRKRLKELEEKIAILESAFFHNSEAIDLLADEMGAEIVECDCCGELMLDFGDNKK